MKKNAHKDYTGVKYGLLTFINKTEKRTEHGTWFWKIKCDCGTELIDIPNHAVTGRKKSCGCNKNRLIKEARTTHGKSFSKEHNSWLSMKQRCLNPNTAKYHLYGGRGVGICKEWNTFQQFYKDMGPAPVNTTIDRIDVNGNYEPSNCRWASPIVQANNIRSNKHVVLYGERLTYAQASRRLGIYPSAITNRCSKTKETSQSVCDYFSRKQFLFSIDKCKHIIEKTIEDIAA